MFPIHSWPRLSYEDHMWVPTLPSDLIPRAIRDAQRNPYRAAVTPTIAHLNPIMPSSVAALADEASAEIARFDTEVGREVAPFTSVLLRSESASSSMIENLSSGAKAIALAELGHKGKRNASEIVGNVRAMRAALDLATSLDEHAIIEMHRALLIDHAPDIVGEWRQSQVWIGGNSYGPHGADFIPPHHRHVKSAIDDLILFVRRNDVPVLCQAAIAHAQFETIHPFPDGNGRTGRALIHAMLRGKGLARLVTVPVSAGLLTNTQTYFDALTAYHDGVIEPIVEQLAHATFQAITNGRQLVRELSEIFTLWIDKTHARHGTAQWQLMETLMLQPVIEASSAADTLGTTTKNVLRVINKLVDAGILTEFTGHGRNRLWQSSEILTALDAFAERAGRRS